MYAILYSSFSFSYVDFFLDMFTFKGCMHSIIIMRYNLFNLFLISLLMEIHIIFYFSSITDNIEMKILVHISPGKARGIYWKAIRKNKSSEQGGQLQNEYIKINSFLNIPTGTG